MSHLVPRNLCVVLASFVAVLLSAVACAHEVWTPVSSGGYSLEAVNENGQPLRSFMQNGRTFILGQRGERYLLRVRNQTGRRIEAVVSVDGRDVLDGRPASYDRRGYLVDAYGDLTIDGFRISQESVAAFRFSSVPESYASRMGGARNVGVIGLAVFAERERPVFRPMQVPTPSGSGSAEGWSSAKKGAWNEAAPAAPEAQASNAPATPMPAPSAASAPSGLESKAAPSASGDLAQGPAHASPMMRRERSGLGTAFGEEHSSHVDVVPFVRASSAPATVLSLHYNDRGGLLALGIDVDGTWNHPDETYLRETAQPFPTRTSYASPPPGWR